MAALYDSFKNGDLRTIVKRFNKGDELRMVSGVIVLKANVKMKVTEEYNASLNVWMPKKYFLNDMVEVTYEDDRPPPTSMPVAGPGKPAGPFNESWWKRLFS